MKVINRAFLAGFVALLPAVCLAHVKWFVDFDTTKPPLSLQGTLSAPLFWQLLILSTLVILATSILDRKIPDFASRAGISEFFEKVNPWVPKLMRFGTSLFFLVLAIGYPKIILTPELVSDNPYLRYVHLAIAITAFSWRTSFVAGIGIILVYAYAVDKYGMFHMLDYIVFIATGAYLINETVIKGAPANKLIEFVRFALCSCLAWGAIEKFAHPQLFFDLLATHTYITLGFDWTLVVMAAGFVEFCCAYHLYTGKTASFGAAAVLAFFFFIAIIPFGFIDLVGHFLFIIPLVAIVLTPRQFKPSFNSIVNAGVFVVAVFAYMLVAYGAFYVTHRHLP